jgi:hypothetical protein
LAELEDLYAQFPRLRDARHRITSRPNDEYNCVAWVERDFDTWWEPGFCWPTDLEPDGDDDLAHYIELFQRWGFELCETGDLEDGFLKIAVYAEGCAFHHVAKQLPSGAWSSKAGALHDFRHEALNALDECAVMRGASVVCHMRRPFEGEDPYQLEETGLIRVDSWPNLSRPIEADSDEAPNPA